MKQYVIVGASAAGIAAAEAIRTGDAAARIIMISDEAEPPYFRVMLSFVLAGKFDRKKMPLRPEKFYRSLDIAPLFGKRVVSLEPQKNRVTLDDRTSIGYDALLLATGARPWPLTVPGSDRDGVFYFRTGRDLDAITAMLKPSGRAVVIGGGLVGIKVADALLDRKMDVTMMVSSNTILSQTADPGTADMVLKTFKQRGVTIMTGTYPKEFQGRGNDLETVVTNNGDRLACQLAVIGKGVLPNTDLAAQASLDVGKGIITNLYLGTNIPNIFAAGDAAQTLDIVSGQPELHSIWPAAVEEGRTAGFNMCGMNLNFWGTIQQNAFYINGSHVITGGMFNPHKNNEGKGNGDDEYRVLEAHDHKKNVHHRIVTRNHRIVGMGFVNDTASAGVALAMIRRKQTVFSLPPNIASSGLKAGRVYTHGREHEIGHH